MGPNISRLHTLDYLRGFSAFGIMVYHLTLWSNCGLDGSSFINRFGVYGVSIFYVLSGLTLYHVYYRKMTPSPEDLISFYLKRFFRIYPLLLLVIFLTLAVNQIVPGWKALLLNVTGLFGIVKWNAYYATGSWSIGNELVFYLFFPVFVFLAKRSKAFFYIFSLLILGCYLYFPFIKFNSATSLDKVWADYVNPLNQVFLFLGGFLIGYWFEKVEIRNWAAFSIALTAILIFIYYPAVGNIAAGMNRIVFTLTAFIICLALYKITLQLPQLIKSPLSLLGDISYSVYLVHPIIWAVFVKFVYPVMDREGILEAPFRIVTVIMVSLICSYLIYRYYEKIFIRYGNRKITGRQQSALISAAA